MMFKISQKKEHKSVFITITIAEHDRMHRLAKKNGVTLTELGAQMLRYCLKQTKEAA